ncbi:hypothetical protein [Streptomyces sp. NPDC002156]
MLRAVERYRSERGRSEYLLVPGAAHVIPHPLLEFSVKRRLVVPGKPEDRKEPRRKAKEISRLPTYTDLDTLEVPVPSGFDPPYEMKMVLAGSIRGEPCPDCDAGALDCGACKASGKQDCQKRVKCKTCGGGANACWSCGGAGKRGSRKPPAKAQNKVRIHWCELCGADDMACPDCRGTQTKKCPDCDGTGHRACVECKGSKRVEHKPCAGSGYFTFYTRVVIDLRVTPDSKRIQAPTHLRWQARRAGWRQEILTSPAAELPADLPETLRTEVESRLALAKGEVLREATLRYLPVARVTVEGDPEWVYFVFPEPPEAGGGLKVVRRPARQRVVRLAGLTAAAVVIAALVALLAMQVTG